MPILYHFKWLNSLNKLKSLSNKTVTFVLQIRAKKQHYYDKSQIKHLNKLVDKHYLIDFHVALTYDHQTDLT